MGETVTEGTIVRWLKQPGDQVAEDEPLLEISTDKVDSEIPSPRDGTLLEVLVAEGETVAIGTPIARLADHGDVEVEVEVEVETPEPAAATATAGAPRPRPAPGPSPAPPPARGEGGAFLSPVVRRLIVEHGLDPAQVEGTGADGRITRDDVLAATVGPATDVGPDVERVPFTAMRRTIGRRMVASLQEAAHTLVVTEVDYHRVAPAKEAAQLTWLPFIARAAIDALAEHPRMNALVDDDGLDVHHHVHLGIAVDLDYEGLVVPVVRDADRLRLRPLAEALAERARAARAEELGPDDFNGGTFTITNAGRYGTLLTAPIINRPQASILATEGVKVRPVAVDLPDGGHGLAFHPVGNLALSFDHRAIDGAYASAFVARVRDILQTRSWTEETGP
jgi:2-oxoglutarate dehydrogenase E2 component (dihydrolipoamide succinyltransferase)